MPELRHPETEFEHEDLSAGGILGFLAGLAITGFVIHIILVGMYVYLDTYQKKHEPEGSPLVRRTGKEDMRQPTPEIANKFPLPRLEVNERNEIYAFRRKEEETLNTYAVDPKTGVVHIPIERAMQLVAQRGLPVAAQSPQAAKKPGESTEPANRERRHPVSNVPQQR
jgi:hypothetical protein